jgi:hypothetical protein
MTRWTSNFWPRIELDVSEGWSVEEYENCASFAHTDGSWVTVDVNPHEMPESDAVGVISILSRSPGLRLLELGEVEVGGRAAWRFEADVVEDMT